MTKRPHLFIVASAGEFQADYEAALRKRRAEHGPATSTIDAFWYLVRENDPPRLKAWLDRHPADEVRQLLKLLDAKA